ncbi:P-loop containing nucleoside triphosphate hydrolase [Aureliella helgolandensis]|uniref:P-loop containing nucleoside triphosphate hydrolase n=2 Tax=Aureliella helgolandensis TaxID=2527968 RepID=A0A518GAM6_9BACT|nr:P-loop containing nucleoside triphosphate hydrolase [Aureliella helgolandensis]
MNSELKMDSNPTGAVQPRRRVDFNEAPVPGEGVESQSSSGRTPLKLATPYVLEARQLYKTYRKNKHAVPVLKGCDFTAVAGRTTAILGQSGSGKSTLLHLLGTLDAPDAGEIYFDGERIDQLPRRRRDRFRNNQLGMIFQFYHLLPEVSAYQNVLMPMMIQEGFFGYLKNRAQIKKRATELLTRVGLAHRMHHKPRELSGGEMQRAAIARALIAEPDLLLADEPTGNLDRETGAQILDLLAELNRERGLTIVMVTHDESIAAACDSTIHLEDGRIKA